MKKFKTLTIRAPHGELVALLDTLKKQDKSIFTYKRTKSNEYARNIFHEENTVGCFSTNRKTLSKASVWVVITNEELTITNITPNEIGSLGVVMYNTILQTFYEDFLAKFLDEDMMEKPRVFDPRGRSCADPRKRFYFDPQRALAGGVIFISPYLPALAALI
ncbi:MAG: hypothetical protein IKP91_06420, partial [Bacteroidaceae bacterium]|nr:hypothetical protein [Bacteroidaceae bacterium]